MRIATQVSKAHPEIKKILAATVGKDWQGRRVSVVQVDPSWTFSLYGDSGEPHVWRVRFVSMGGLLSALRVPRPKEYGGSATSIDAPSGDELIVTKDLDRSVTIYAPMLDQATLDVARDALAEGNKKQAVRILANLGFYAVLARAIIESQTKSIEKVTSGKTSRQLDREIAEFMKGRS
jgi:hypothetical protein